MQSDERQVSGSQGYGGRNSGKTKAKEWDSLNILKLNVIVTKMYAFVNILILWDCIL